MTKNTPAPEGFAPGATVLFRGKSYVLASIMGSRVTLVGSGQVLTIFNPYFIQWGSPWLP